MRFQNPEILFTLLIIPIFIVFIAFNKKIQQKRFKKFGEVKFYDFFYQNFSHFGYNLKNSFLLIALFFLIIAASRPQWGNKMQTMKKEGIDIAICLDVSKSMLAEDIQPNRIKRAKDDITKFLSKLKGDRVTLIPFAGKSFIQCPLTDDYAAAKMFLDLLDTDSISQFGTNIGEALQRAQTALGFSDKHKILILISDGEDLEEKSLEIAKELYKNGIKIYTLGVGSLEGTTIPITDSNGNVSYAKDSEGNIVLTKLDIKNLNEISKVTSGKFFSITPQQSEIYAILNEIEKIEKNEYNSKNFMQYKEQYHNFLFIALFFIFIELLIWVKQKSEYDKYVNENI